MGLFIYLDDEENTVIETPLMRFYVLRHPVYVYVYATSDANRAQSAPPCLIPLGFASRRLFISIIYIRYVPIVHRRAVYAAAVILVYYM